VNPVNNASVIIAAAPGATVCAGTSVTLTATPVSSASPSYQWYLNGSPVGTDQATYTFTPVNSGDQVYVSMNSVEPCSVSPVSSNQITFTVNPLLTPSITISPANPSACSGSNVTFTATPTNGGSTPSYAWFVNNVDQGVNNPSFTYTPANIDQVHAVLTTSETCFTAAIAQSNTATVTITASYNVVVTIAADNADVCEGTTVNFTADNVSGGSGVSYEWYVNALLQVGSTGAGFTYIPIDNDQIYARMTDIASCAVGSPAISNTLTINVTPSVVVGVTIAANQTSVCSGASVTFTAAPVNGGSIPSYEWYVNTVLQSGQTTANFNYVPLDGDQVYATLSNNESCVTGSPANSNTISLTVIQAVTVSVSLTADQTSICTGSTVTFTANPTNGGTTPQYVFNVNGTDQPVQASPVFTYPPLNGNTFFVTLFNSETCATGSPALSNSITITVSASLPVSVSVTADQNPICSGSPASYTAIPANGGASPVYAWYLNTVLQPGFTGPTYTNNTPADGEQVYVLLTNIESCATGSPAQSNTVTLGITGPKTTTVSLVVDQPTVCSGSQVIFTATPTYGGNNPDYTWYLGGVEQTLASGPVFSYNPATDISVYVVLVSDETCANPNTDQSLPIDVAVSDTYMVGVTASITSAGQLCQGDNVIVSAGTSTGGPSPQYQWYRNSSAVAGETNPTFTFIPDNNDEVYVTLTNAEACATGSPATSPLVTIPVNTPSVVDVSVNAAQSWVCSGGVVQYIATPQNGGLMPAYNWYVGSTVQAETSEFFNYSPAPGEMVYAVLTSNADCITNNPAQSADFTVSVITGPEASVSLTSNSNSVCNGELVIFNATPVNEGLTPVYRWLVNGVEESVSGNIFSYTPANGDQVSIEITSSEVCASNNPAIAEETVELSPCGFVMRMPGSFTPNGDQLNDVFKPVIGDILPVKYLLQIFDRWGGIVFETNNPDQGWDGTFKGQPAERGIYSYKLEFEIPEYISSSLKNPLREMIILLR